MKYPEVKNYITGSFVDNGHKTMEVHSPIDGVLLSTVPLSGKSDLDDAVKAAQTAYPEWSAKPIKERVQVFYKYKALVEANLAQLAQLVHEENGKTMAEATAEVEKSVELTEFACSMPQLVSGEVMEVSKGVECRTEHKPLGVVASIVPFNFPHMVPHWTVPNAIRTRQLHDPEAVGESTDQFAQDSRNAQRSRIA